MDPFAILSMSKLITLEGELKISGSIHLKREAISQRLKNEIRIKI